MLVTPEYVFKDVTHITPEWLAAKGITALVLDIDNTLTADRSQELPEEVPTMAIWRCFTPMRCCATISAKGRGLAARYR